MLLKAVLIGTGLSLILCYNLTQYSQNDYILESERWDLIRYNKAIIETMKNHNFKYNRTHFALNATATLKVDLNYTLMLRIQIYKFASNEYRLFPVWLPVSYCEITSKDIFGVQDYFRHGNNLPKCPVKKGRYWFRNYAPDYSKFPPNLPRGRYMADINVTSLDADVFEAQWYINIKDAYLP